MRDAIVITSPTGYADTELVSVAETVDAGEAVVAEELHEIEVRLAGVEDGELILGAQWNVGVAYTRLESLQSLRFAHAALEHGMGVERDDGRGARQLVACAGRGARERIARMFEREARGEAQCSRAERETELRQ